MKLFQWIVTGVIILFAITAIALANYIAPQDELQRANVIVAVSGGNTSARTLEAVRLYQENWAPRLIFSGAALDPVSPSNASAMRQIAIKEGIPPDVITVDEQAINTTQNANEVAYIVEALGYNKIILVTSPYHQRRTYLEFRERLGDNVEIINHSAPDNVWEPDTWWKSATGWQLTFGEGIKAFLTTFRYR